MSTPIIDGNFGLSLGIFNTTIFSSGGNLFKKVHVYNKLTLQQIKCGNGLQDEDENGVDCGGSCPAICLNNIEWTKISRFNASDGVIGDTFGRSIAIDENKILVGAPMLGQLTMFYFPARNYFYNISNDNVLIEQEIKENFVGTTLGQSVALYENWAVIGAPRNNSARIYRYLLGQWTNVNNFIPSSLDNSENYGVSVDIENNIMAVGASGNSTSPGKTFIYKYDGNTWELEKVISKGEMGDGFGWAVSINGTRILVGALRASDSEASVGRAYLYEYNLSSPEIWQLEKEFYSSSQDNEDYFGISVDISNDMIVVGATGEDGLCLNSGAAYVFVNDGTDWIESDKLISSNCAMSGFFGNDVIFGNVLGEKIIFVSANQENVPGHCSFDNCIQGRVYSYRFNNVRWVEDNVFSGDDPITGVKFGTSIATNQNYLAISSPAEFNPPPARPGEVYVYKASVTQQQCTQDADCNDNLFCNGIESCGATMNCIAGTNPCIAMQTCNEQTDSCTICVDQNTLNGYINQYYSGSRTITQISEDITQYLNGC